MEVSQCSPTAREGLRAAAAGDHKRRLDIKPPVQIHKPQITGDATAMTEVTLPPRAGPWTWWPGITRSRDRPCAGPTLPLPVCARGATVPPHDHGPPPAQGLEAHLSAARHVRVPCHSAHLGSSHHGGLEAEQAGEQRGSKGALRMQIKYNKQDKVVIRL